MTGDDRRAEGDPGDRLLVGTVARAHGHRGGVIVNPETDFAADRFKEGEVLLVSQVAEPESAVPRRILESRFHQGRPVIRLEGIESMNDAERLAGAALHMPVSSLGPLPERTYYRHDLVGCEVRDTHGALIGRVTRVEGTLDRSHLVVPRQGGEAMIPLVDGICVSVDIPGRRVVVDPPEGLLDL
jgi:16S rRNA processing protein RimM